MTFKSIEEKIDSLFTPDEHLEKEGIRAFVEGIRENHVEAEKNVRRAYIVLVVVWVLFYGIGVGLVEEGQVASFKISRVKQLIIAAPILLGAYSYLLLSSTAAAAYLGDAVSRCYKHLLPRAYNENLEYLLWPPTFLGVERILAREAKSQWMNKLSVIWLRSVEASTLVISLGAVAHVSYLLLDSGLFPWYYASVSVCIGAVFWFRGALLIVVSVEK